MVRIAIARMTLNWSLGIELSPTVLALPHRSAPAGQEPFFLATAVLVPIIHVRRCVIGVLDRGGKAAKDQTAPCRQSRFTGH